MSAKDEGIFVPRRLMFIMIFVSLCVNVFFLLMGILIGKDDIKWQEQEGEELPVAQVSEDPDPRKALEDDLSVFDEPVATERRPPIDRRYLEEDAVKSTPTRSESSPPVETRAEVEPSEMETRRDPEPEVIQKRVEPPKTRPAPTRSQGEKAASSGTTYWIQVMAISDRGKAQAFLNKVKSKGFGAVMVNEGAFHKIRVGPYHDRAKADEARSRVNSSLGVKGWVVKN